MWSLELVKNGLAHLEIQAEDCAILARALMLAEENSVDPQEQSEVIRAYRLAFQALTIALAYQTNVDKMSEERTKEYLGTEIRIFRGGPL